MSVARASRRLARMRSCRVWPMPCRPQDARISNPVNAKVRPGYSAVTSSGSGWSGPATRRWTAAAPYRPRNRPDSRHGGLGQDKAGAGGDGLAHPGRRTGRHHQRAGTADRRTPRRAGPTVRLRGDLRAVDNWNVRSGADMATFSTDACFENNPAAS